MISLVVLPLVCVIYLFKDRILPKYGRMELIIFSKDEFSKFRKDMIKPLDMNDINTYRKYNDISFTGNPGHDAEEQARLKTLLVRLNNKTDRVNGIRITLNKYCKYKDMVTAIDNCYQGANRATGFAMIDNKIFIYQPGAIKLLPAFIPPCGGLRTVPPASKQLLLSQMLPQLVKFWPSAIAFIGMIYFAVSKRRYYILH